MTEISRLTKKGKFFAWAAKRDWRWTMAKPILHIIFWWTSKKGEAR